MICRLHISTRQIKPKLCREIWSMFKISFSYEMIYFKFLSSLKMVIKFSDSACQISQVHLYKSSVLPKTGVSLFVCLCTGLLLT